MPETQTVTGTHPVALWAHQTVLDPFQVDCITTIMLKILDGKCKMFEDEKETISIIYDVIKNQPGELLRPEVRELIARAQQGMDDALVMEVYEQRLYAETIIGRPRMKAFKAMLRKQGVLRES